MGKSTKFSKEKQKKRLEARQLDYEKHFATTKGYTKPGSNKK